MEITELDVTALSAEEAAELKQAAYEHRLLVIREQTLTKPEYIAFARKLGRAQLLDGNSLHKKSGAAWDDFRDRTDPKPGQFMLSVPTWNLKNPRQENSTLGLGTNPKVDPILDDSSRPAIEAPVAQQHQHCGR